jgi:hypothetical protein
MLEAVSEFRLQRVRDHLILSALAAVLIGVCLGPAMEAGPVFVALVLLAVGLPVAFIWAAFMRSTRASLGPGGLVISGPFGRRAAIRISDIETVRVGYTKGRHLYIKSSSGEVGLGFGMQSDQSQVLALMEALHATPARHAFDSESTLLLDCARRASLAQQAESTDHWLNAARSAAANGSFGRARLLYRLAGDAVAPGDRDVLRMVMHITAPSRAVSG